MLSQLYDDLAPPMPGHVYLVAHSTTAARYVIPRDWRGKIVSFSSSGADLYLLLGNANTMIESAKVATVVTTPEVLSPHWGSGYLIPAGSTIPIPIPDITGPNADPLTTHFVVDSSAASGQWCACVASGSPGFGEQLPSMLGDPILWLDSGRRDKLTVDSGAVTVSAAKCRVNGYEFTESTNKPDLLTSAGVGSGLLRPAIEFITGSSEKLVSTDATLAALFGSANAWTLYLNARRGATGALHTIFSVGTSGSNNGRWDVTYDASDDILITRVTSGGVSTTSTFTTTINGANTVLITFDGTTPLLWVDGTSASLSGTATGNVGTTTKVGIGCRAYNTSTADQFANAQICDVLAFNTAFTGDRLNQLQSWIRRRAGK